MALGVTEKSFIIAIFLAIFALILYYSKLWRLYCKVSKYPGPPAIPIFGNALDFFGNSVDFMNKFHNLMHVYPSPFRVWLGSEPILTVYEPDQMKAIMYSPKCIEKPRLYKFGRVWLGDGLLSAPAPLWRHHRKIIVPTFHQKILDSFIEIFTKQSELMVRLMRKELKGGEFKIIDYISLCTLDIICETAMGVTMNTQTHQNGRYVNAVQRMMQIMWTRTFKVWLHPNFIFHSSPLGKEHEELLKCLFGMADDVIRKKRQIFADNGHSDKNENSLKKSADKKPFLDLLMEISMDEDKFTDKELRDEVNTMIVAGYDTTASANNFALLMLAMHPEIQEKVYEELCEIYGDKISSSVEISNEDLNRMQFLERVIKETLRLFPVGPLFGRTITEDLDIGGHIIPKDSSVMFGVIKLHRWDKYWSDPLVFNPDRFLPEEVAKRHPDCYMPFSAGPRNCIGLKYAMMAMKVLLSMVLRHYVVKKDKPMKVEDIKISSKPVMQPIVPITVRIEKR